MRKSISVAFFSLVSTLMVLGIVLMGFSEWVLFSNYFAIDKILGRNYCYTAHYSSPPVSLESPLLE